MKEATCGWTRDSSHPRPHSGDPRAEGITVLAHLSPTCATLVGKGCSGQVGGNGLREGVTTTESVAEKPD